MGAMMRAYNWETHPLGSPAHWPQSLKANIRLLLHAEFPMFIWWSKNLYDFHNDPYTPALGNKHPTALGKAASEIWSEIWADIGGIVEQVMGGGQSFYAENLLLYLERKGFPEETYWTFSYSPAFDDQGQVAGVFCACTEVTNTILGQRRLATLKDIADAMAHIQTQEQVCQSASQVLSENQQDLPFSQIYLLTGNGRQAQRMGWSGTIGAQVPTVISLEKDQAATDAWPLWQVQETKRQVLLEDLTLYIGGSATNDHQGTSTSVALVPIFRPGHDQILGFFVAAVSPRLEFDTDYQNFFGLLAGQIATSIASVQAREEMARQQEELVNLFEQAPVAICIMLGENYVVELANPGICELWGKKPEDVMGKPVLEALPEVRDQGIKELLDSVYTTGVPYVNTELPIKLMRNGQLETLYANFVYQPMRDRLGQITGVIAVATSVNEQVAARQEIETMNTELRAINADLDNFVYSASHDLKAPISNIEGLMETLVEHLPPQTQQLDIVQRVLSLMQASVGRFKRAVSDLTEVAKIQRGAEEDVASLRLAEVVQDVQLDFERDLQNTGAQVETHFDEGTTIRFSAKNARSIIYNLFSNALKYRSPDRTPEIRINAHATPDFVVLSVADNGLGIPAEDQDKVFSMFKRLHDHVEGTGIGLYIVKRIVENAGGKIELESELGKGSTFTVYFKR